MHWVTDKFHTDNEIGGTGSGVHWCGDFHANGYALERRVRDNAKPAWIFRERKHDASGINHAPVNCPIALSAKVYIPFETEHLAGPDLRGDSYAIGKNKRRLAVH